MDDAQAVDDDDVAGAGDKPEPFVAFIGRAAEPCQKSIAIVDALPVREITEKDESARRHVQDVEDFRLVRDVLLKAEAFAGPLQKDGITKGACGLDGVRLVLQQKAEI